MAKKQVMKAVVLGAVAAFSVTAAIAQTSEKIKGSPHDLTNPDSAGTTKHAGVFYDNFNQICVYCHTPHNANTDNNGELLWNRPMSAATYKVYTSPTFNATMAPPTKTSSSALCLSCHDGTIAVDSVLRRPIAGGPITGSGDHARMDTSGGTDSCGSCHNPGGFGSGGVTKRVAKGFLGTDLSNDHPVNMTYDASSADTGLKPATTVATAGLKLYDGKVQCASCHDPHVYKEKAFLRVSNAGSALCMTCHAK